MDNNNMSNQEPQGFQTQQPYQQPYEQQYQQPYQQPYQQVYQNDNLEEPVSFGEWMIALLLMMVPCVNIIMMFVFAFGDGKKSKSNFFKAYLVWMLIGIILSVIICVAFGASMAAIFSSISY